MHHAASDMRQALRRGREVLALERNIVVLLAALLVLGMGEELWTRFVPRYLEVLGASAWIIGAYGSLQRIVDAFYQYPGGAVSDWLGRKRALVLFNIIAATGYLIYLLSPSWPVFLAGTLLVMVWSSMSQPAIFALIGDTLKRSQRAMGFSVQSIWKRVPIVLAPPIGGWLMTRMGIVSGMKIGFACSLVLALAAIYLQEHFYIAKPPAEKRMSWNLISLWREMVPGLKRLLLADCLARIGSNIAAVYVVLYVLNILGGTPLQFGLLTSIQMTVSILGYIPAARLADRFGRRPFIIATFAFFALFPLTLALVPSASWLPLAFAINGLREIGEPARKALIVDLAADAHRGRAVGLYYLIRGLVTIPAPLVGSWLWQQTPRLVFLTAFAVGVLGLIAFIWANPSEEPMPAS